MKKACPGIVAEGHCRRCGTILRTVGCTEHETPAEVAARFNGICDAHRREHDAEDAAQVGGRWKPNQRPASC